MVGLQTDIWWHEIVFYNNKYIGIKIRQHCNSFIIIFCNDIIPAPMGNQFHCLPFYDNILFIVQEKESESEEKEKAEGTKDVEKKEEIETNEAKKIVEALTGTDASTCKKLQ